MDDTKDIFDFIKSEESAYKQPIWVNENWSWGMYKHVVEAVTYKYGQLATSKTDDKPVKNIILPILRLRYRTEGFDLKDIELFVDDKDQYWKSFLVQKFHIKWAEENHMDTFIDQGSETDIDFGGVLVKTVGKVPEVVKWESVAFCDQTNVLSGPIGIKHNYSPDQLMEMADKGWGKPENGADRTIEDVIALSEDSKRTSQNNGQENKTPGRYIEVYEVNGMLRDSFMKDGVKDKVKFTRQMQIVTFLTTTSGEKKGTVLYQAYRDENPFKFRTDEIFNRCIGYGGVEELVESQVWTTYDKIRIKGMLDFAAKTVIETTDETLASKHPTGLKNLDNGSIVAHAPSTTIGQLNTSPVNLSVFERDVNEWEVYARQAGFASEALMGENPTAGTPFKLQDLVVTQGLGIHEYRMGKFATFIGDLYREDIIPQMAKELSSGAVFLSELDLDELQYTADALVVNETNRVIKEKVLSGEDVDPQEIEILKQTIRDEFKKRGNKHFIEILKGEFKKTKLNVRVNIKGKQKNMVGMVDKITNIFRFAFSNPQGFTAVLQIPGMAKSFNEILEYSGLSPVDFTGIDKLAEQQAQPTDTSKPSPIQVTQPQNA